VKVLVTGGTGFVGSHLVERLLDDPEVDVYLLVRNPAKARRLAGRPRVHLVEGDLRRVPALPAGLSVVYHLAGVTKTFKSSEHYTVNREGTASLLRALERTGDAPRIVLVSSLAAAGPSAAGRPVRESDPPRPVSPYGKSKLAAEEEALRLKGRFPVVILRPAAIYGPRDEDFLGYFRWVGRGVVILFGRGEKRLSLCHVDDLVRAVILAGRATCQSGEVINIAAPEPATWREIGTAAARILGRRSVVVRVPLWTTFLACSASQGIGRLRRRPTAVNLSKYQEARPAGWVADVEKARRVLGFEARVTLEAGLKGTLEWYRREGLL
jgi:dihydroflavonol-4-reductase